MTLNTNGRSTPSSRWPIMGFRRREFCELFGRHSESKPESWKIRLRLCNREGILKKGNRVVLENPLLLKTLNLQTEKDGVRRFG